MGYLDAQNAQRNAATAVAKAESAKTAAQSAVAAANAGSTDKATAASLAAKANDAITAYNTAAQTAKASSMFATDWFGITTNQNLTGVYDPNFLTTTGLDKNLYTPTAYSSVSPTVLPEKEMVGTSKTALIKAKLAALQIPTELIEKSVLFIESAISDGMAVDDAVDIYYNNKDFTTKAGTTISSPFYSEYTFLRESAPKTGNPPSPLELMQFKLGVKRLVETYGNSSLYSTDESLKKYISNEVKLTDLDTRFAAAKLKATEADPTLVSTMKKLGYISDAQGLADFYADNSIGQKQFEINKQTTAFANQAMKRAGTETGITFNSDRMKQLAAAYAGGDEAAAEQAGATGYATIAQQLNPLTKLEGIYNKSAVSQKELTPTLQAQLEEEQFRGTASELRKKRIEQEQLAFQAKSGTVQASRLSQGSLGTASTTGLI